MSELPDENESLEAAAPAVLPPVDVAPPAPAPAVPSDAVVESWFAKHFHGMGALIDERTYNLLHAAKEDLKRVLAAVSPL